MGGCCESVGSSTVLDADVLGGAVGGCTCGPVAVFGCASCLGACCSMGGGTAAQASCTLQVAWVVVPNHARRDVLRQRDMGSPHRFGCGCAFNMPSSPSEGLCMVSVGVAGAWWVVVGGCSWSAESRRVSKDVLLLDVG